MVKDPRFNSHWSLKDNRFMYLTFLFLEAEQQVSPTLISSQLIYRAEKVHIIIVLSGVLGTGNRDLWGQRQLYVEGGRLESYPRYDISRVSSPLCGREQSQAVKSLLLRFKDAILSQQPSVSIVWSSLDRSVDPSCLLKTTLSHHILWIIILKKI